MVDPQTAQQTESLKEYMNIFKTILDCSLADWDVAYSILPASKKEYWFINRDKFTDFCRKVRSTEAGEKQCLECTFRHSKEAAQTLAPISYLCDAGLIDIAGPVIVQGEHIASISCGQRRPEDEYGQREGLRRARQIEGKLGFKQGELVKLWEQASVISQDQVEMIKKKLVEVAGHVSKLIEDKRDLEEQRTQSATRLRETRAIQDIIARLGKVVTVDKFWLRVNKALNGVCKTIGAHFGLVLVSGEGGKVFTVKASSDWRRKAFVGRNYYADDSPFLHQALRDRVPFDVELDDYLEDKLCFNVLEYLHDVIPTSAIAVSFELGGEQVGIMTFFSEPQLDTERGGLPFEEEKDMLGVIALQITTAFQNCQLYTEQKKLERERIRFIQDITHQLIGPLAGIHAHCENLFEERLSADRIKTVLRALIEQSRMSARYARNFALVARAELEAFSEIEVDLRKQDLTKLLIECAWDLQGLADSHGIRIHVDKETVDTLPRIAVDKLLFKQAVTNLLDNAVKYSNENTIITVRASSDAREARLYFINYGIPVYRKDIPRMFQRYFRSKEAKEKATVGTGIGLFIAREIIRLHSGRISIEPSTKTSQGYKTTFTITLPISRGR